MEAYFSLVYDLVRNQSKSTESYTGQCRNQSKSTESHCTMPQPIQEYRVTLYNANPRVQSHIAQCHNQSKSKESYIVQCHNQSKSTESYIVQCSSQSKSIYRVIHCPMLLVRWLLVTCRYLYDAEKASFIVTCAMRKTLSSL